MSLASFGAALHNTREITRYVGNHRALSQWKVIKEEIFWDLTVLNSFRSIFSFYRWIYKNNFAWNINKTFGRARYENLSKRKMDALGRLDEELKRAALIRSLTDYLLSHANNRVWNPRAGLWKRNRAHALLNPNTKIRWVRCCLLIWVLGIKFCRSIDWKQDFGKYRSLSRNNKL